MRNRFQPPTTNTGWLVTFQPSIPIPKDEILKDTLDFLMLEHDSDERHYLKKMLEDNWQLILKCRNVNVEAHFIAELTAAFKQINDTQGKEHFLFDLFLAKITLPQVEAPSAIAHFAKTFIQQFIATVAPTATFAITLSNLMAPVATAELFSVFEGVPEGLASLCAQAQGCVEGWIETNANNSAIAQFSRSISKGQDIGGEKHCFTIKNVGNALVDSFEKNMPEIIPNATACEIKAPSRPGVKINIPNISNETCINLSKDVSQKLRACIDNSMFKEAAIITGAILGMFTFACCVSYAVTRIHCHSSRPANRQEDLPAVELGVIPAAANQNTTPPVAESETPGGPRP